MSLKENIHMVKEELSSEEKFFEKAVVTEKFITKYKKVLIGSVVAIALVVAADIAYDINKEHTIKAANEALAKLQINSKDAAALSELKTLSPALYDVWTYSQAVVKGDVKALASLEKSPALLLGDLSSYEVAQNTQDVKKLTAYAQKQNAIYRDLARVEAAIIFIHEGKVNEAHSKLSMISASSPLSNIAKALMHYGVK